MTKRTFSFSLPCTQKEQPEIDALLSSSENTQALCEYVILNPSAKDYLNLRLYYLANSFERYHEDAPRYAKRLLTGGANPNYIHDNDNSEGYKSVLEVAADYGKDWLVEILLEHGAKTTLFVAKKLSPKEFFKQFCKTKEEEEALDKVYEKENKVLNASEAEKIDNMVRRKKLPIQVAFKNYKLRFNASVTKICTLLSQKTILELDLEPKLRRLFATQYEILYKNISKAFAEALKNNQQFIIMVGEYHEGLSSLVIEQMILLISKELGISTLLTEHNKYMEDCLNERGYIPTREREWLVSLTINKHVKSQNIRTIPVDLGHFGAKKIGEGFNDYENLTWQKEDFDDTSPEGVKYRNEIIRNVIVDGIKSHCMLFVGATHLFGLKKETTFPDTLAIFPINAEKKIIKRAIQENGDNTEMLQYILESSDILQTEVELDELCEFLSPEIIIVYVSNAHYQFHLKKNQDLLFFKNSYNPEILDVGTAKSGRESHRCVMLY